VRTSACPGHERCACRAQACPAWSSYATRGLAILDADPFFLGFWGCACPEGAFWGYGGPRDAILAALHNEVQAMTPETPFGGNLSVLSRRTCVPCPPFVACSPLTVPAAPHRLVGSRYPLPTALPDRAPRLRMDFVYAPLLPCLHPAVCNRAPALTATSWTEWAQLTEAGVTQLADFGEFLCREGHDASSLLCSRCLNGYWLDGFLCHRCERGYGALVAVALVACTVLLALYISVRARASTADRHATAGASFPAQTVATTLWYLQVSAALALSSQARRASRHARTLKPCHERSCAGELFTR
jgi:hypothetical protein